MRAFVIASTALPLLAGGCLHAVGTVVTAPVKIVSKTVDWTTTSQSEADRNRGRKMRRQEERDARERRKADAACRKDATKCGRDEGYRPGG